MISLSVCHLKILKIERKKYIYYIKNYVIRKFVNVKYVKKSTIKYDSQIKVQRQQICQKQYWTNTQHKLLDGDEIWVPKVAVFYKFLGIDPKWIYCTRIEGIQKKSN